MKRRRRKAKADVEEEERGTTTTPVQEEEDKDNGKMKKKKKKVARRVAFSEEPDSVLVFDRRDPVGSDFHDLFASDTSTDNLTNESGVLQPIDTSSDGQTTPQMFSLHEFVASFVSDDLFFSFFSCLFDQQDWRANGSTDGYRYDVIW